MSPHPSLEKTLREFVAREVAKALAPYLDLLDGIERLFAPVRQRPARRMTATRARPRRRRVPWPALTTWEIQVLKYLATDLKGLDLALATRVSMKDLNQMLRGLYEKLGVADERNPRAAAVRRHRAMMRAPLPPQPIPFAVDQIVRVPQQRGTAEATITAIDPVSGDLTLELVEDGRVLQLPSAKAIRQSA